MLAIAERLSAGETMVSICAEPQMPSAVTVWQWCQEDDELDRIYVQTKKPRARALIEQSTEQLQKLLNDDKVDTRKVDVFVRNATRMAGILDPENFSDKMHAHLGKLGTGNVINVQLNIG